MLIKNHNISVKELNDYVDINIINDNINFNSFNESFKEYRALVSKYYNLSNKTNLYRSDFPQHLRNAFYKELVNLVKKNMLIKSNIIIKQGCWYLCELYNELRLIYIDIINKDTLNIWNYNTPFKKTVLDIDINLITVICYKILCKNQLINRQNLKIIKLIK